MNARRPEVEDEYLSTGTATRKAGLCRDTLLKYGRLGLIDYIKTPTGRYRWSLTRYLEE